MKPNKSINLTAFAPINRIRLATFNKSSAKYKKAIKFINKDIATRLIHEENFEICSFIHKGERRVLTIAYIKRNNFIYIGRAIKHPNDKHDENLGKAIALGRAIKKPYLIIGYSEEVHSRIDNLISKIVHDSIMYPEEYINIFKF